MAFSKETMARPKCRVTKGKVSVVIDGGTSVIKTNGEERSGVKQGFSKETI